MTIKINGFNVFLLILIIIGGLFMLACYLYYKYNKDKLSYKSNIAHYLFLTGLIFIIGPVFVFIITVVYDMKNPINN